MWFLHEQVSTVRWLGVMLIMLGAGLISYSEHQKEKASPGQGIVWRRASVVLSSGED